MGRTCARVVVLYNVLFDICSLVYLLCVHLGILLDFDCNNKYAMEYCRCGNYAVKITIYFYGELVYSRYHLVVHQTYESLTHTRNCLQFTYFIYIYADACSAQICASFSQRATIRSRKSMKY